MPNVLVRGLPQAYDWDDLKRLLRKDQKIEAKTLVRKCVQRYRFLTELTGDEEKIRSDTKRHHEAERVREIESHLKK